MRRLGLLLFCLISFGQTAVAGPSNTGFDNVAVKKACVSLQCLAQFQSFPPGVFAGRAARDAAGGGGASSPTFSWANQQSNAFLGSNTTVNIGSTNQSGACGTILSGDTLIASLVIEGETTDTITPPAGWTLIGTQQNDGANFVAFYFKIAGGSETCSYTFSWTNSHFMAWALADYTGTNGTTPIDVSATSTCASGAGTTCTVTGISPALSPDVLVLFMANPAGASAVTVPADMTQRVNASQESGTTTLLISDRALASSGATGNEVATGVATFKTFLTLLVALTHP